MSAVAACDPSKRSTSADHNSSFRKVCLSLINHRDLLSKIGSSAHLLTPLRLTWNDVLSSCIRIRQPPTTQHTPAAKIVPQHATSQPASPRTRQYLTCPATTLGTVGTSRVLHVYQQLGLSARYASLTASTIVGCGQIPFESCSICSIRHTCQWSSTWSPWQHIYHFISDNTHLNCRHWIYSSLRSTSSCVT